MALSAFDDRSREPRQEELTDVLGPAARQWDLLIPTLCLMVLMVIKRDAVCRRRHEPADHFTIVGC